MIPARLNRLVLAYRRAKALVGAANQGKALLGPALRWCHKIRQAIKAELMVVEAVIRPERLLHNRPQIIPNPTPASAGLEHNRLQKNNAGIVTNNTDRLTANRRSAYTRLVAAKSAAGFGDPSFWVAPRINWTHIWLQRE